MRLRLLSLIFPVLILLLSGTLASAEDNITLLTPPDMMWVNGRLLNLVFNLDVDSIDTVMVTSNYSSDRVDPGPVVRPATYHYSLTLAEGKNSIAIQALKGKTVVADKNVTVFLRSDIVDADSMPPAGFRQYEFHTGFNEKRCTICHDKELRIGAKSRQNEALPGCYTCHKRKLDHEYVHGPASVWACTTCHNPASGEAKNKVPDPEVTVCGICHTEELAAWRSEKFGHGPTLAGKCAFCHNPHASDEKFFLNTDTSDLCGYCHREKLEKPHVVADFFAQGHPVKRAARNGRPAVNCASCHNPHAANNQYLLKGYKTSNMDLCRKCHHTSSK